MRNPHPDAVDAPAESALRRDLRLLEPAPGLRHRLTPN